MHSLSPPSFFCFLARSPYHNSIHAADVLMSTNLFLTSFGLTDRLTKSELLAVLRLPGTPQDASPAPAPAVTAPRLLWLRAGSDPVAAAAAR